MRLGDHLHASAFDAMQLFSSEEMARVNAHDLRMHIRDMLLQRNLPLAVIAYDWFIELNGDKKRKDKITPSEQHEQSHLIRFDALIRACDNKTGWDEKKYGTLDAALTATILHDVLEDHGHDDKQMLAMLQRAVEHHWIDNPQGRASKDATRNEMHKAAKDAVYIVKCLSRNDPMEDGRLPDRTEQTYKILNHPVAVLIKQIDWTNKLATMIGVPDFEKDNQWRMKRNLQETAEIFDTQRGALIERAKEAYPEFSKKFDMLHAEMAITYNIVDGYANHCDPGYQGTPSKERSYNFKSQIELTKSYLKFVPNFANMPWVAQQRVELAGEMRANDPNNSNNPRRSDIKDFNQYVIKPAVASLFAPVPNWSLKGIFDGAVAVCQKVITHPFLHSSKPSQP